MKEVTPTCKGKLHYHSFTIVYFHLFQIGKDSEIRLKEGYVDSSPGKIDSQIFDSTSVGKKQLIKRYKLKDFGFKIKLYQRDDSPLISGRVFIEAARFFDSTVSLTYRLMVDQISTEEKVNYTTDDLIALAGILLGNEHWNTGQNANSTSIDTDIESMDIEDLYIDKNGNLQKEPEHLSGKKEIFSQVLMRYKRLITQNKSVYQSNDLFYVMADIWEDIGHSDSFEFDKVTEPEVINHILDRHKPELMGLFTQYPGEWVYRDPDFFEDICGGNIAIDTDDLILCNENICVVFGTYGKRGGEGAETDWQQHLKEREFFHVSWPEYMAILELLLARKQLVGVLHDTYKNIIDDFKPGNETVIETIANKSLDVNNALLKMDALKFSRIISHRHMYRKTAEQLRISEEFAELNATAACIENQIANLKSIKEKRESDKLTGLLAIISGLSILQFFFLPLEIPILKSIAPHTDLGKTVASVIDFLCTVLFVVGFVLIIRFVIKIIRKK